MEAQNIIIIRFHFPLAHTSFIYAWVSRPRVIFLYVLPASPEITSVVLLFTGLR